MIYCFSLISPSTVLPLLKMKWWNEFISILDKCHKTLEEKIFNVKEEIYTISQKSSLKLT